MKKFANRVLLVLLVSMPLSETLLGEEPSNQSHPSRVEVGSVKSHSKKHRRHSQQAVQEKMISKDWISNTCRPFDPLYYVSCIGVDGSSVILTDESVWTPVGGNSYRIAKWQPNTPVIIKLADQFFCPGCYYLENNITKELVLVKLSQGPLVQYSLPIQSIDPSLGFILLSNGTLWRVYRDFFSPTMYSWKENQAVFIGESGSQYDPYILINVNENAYVRASIVS